MNICVANENCWLKTVNIWFWVSQPFQSLHSVSDEWLSIYTVILVIFFNIVSQTSAPSLRTLKHFIVLEIECWKISAIFSSFKVLFFQNAWLILLFQMINFVVAFFGLYFLVYLFLLMVLFSVTVSESLYYFLLCSKQDFMKLS